MGFKGGRSAVRNVFGKILRDVSSRNAAFDNHIMILKNTGFDQVLRKLCFRNTKLPYTPGFVHGSTTVRSPLLCCNKPAHGHQTCLYLTWYVDHFVVVGSGPHVGIWVCASGGAVGGEAVSIGQCLALVSRALRPTLERERAGG